MSVIMHPENFTDPEAALLGCILIDNKTAPEIRQIVSTEDFRDLRHRAIYSTATKMLDAGEGVDLSTIYSKLDAEGNLKTAGDADYLGSLLDACHNTANATTYAKAVKAKSDRKKKKAAADLLVKSLDGRDDPEAGEKIKAILDGVATTRSLGSVDWQTKPVSTHELHNRELPPIPSIVGEGLVARGSFVIGHGPEGVGKSWIFFQMANAIACGLPDWLGFPVKKGRVLYIGTEINIYVAKHRARRVMELVTPPNQEPLPGTDDFMMIIPPALTEKVSLEDADEAGALAEFVRENKIDLVIFDPWSDFHSLDENSNSDMTKVLQGVGLITATGATVLAIHHDRKPAQGVETDSDRGRLRGASKLRTKASTVFSLSKISTSVIKLEVTKTNFCEAPPEPTYLLNMEEDGGGYVVTAPPEDQAEQRGNRKTTVAVEVIRSGKRGISLVEIMETDTIRPLSLGKRTVQRYLDELADDKKIDKSGKGRATRYHPLGSIEVA